MSNASKIADAPQEPFFSIIISAYNAEKTLRQAVSSAIRQSLDDSLYEIVIVDDGSTDGTPALLEQLRRQAGNMVVHTSPENRGLGAGRNRGIALASGRYVTFLDADDFLTADALELFLDSMDDSRPDIVVADFARISPFGDPLSAKGSSRHSLASRRSEALSGKHTFCCFGAAYAKRFLERYAIAFAEGIFYEDIPFVTHSVLRAADIRALDAVVYHWVAWENTITGSISRKKIQDAITAWEMTHAVLDGAGLLSRHARDWEQGAAAFMRTIHGRIQLYSDGSDTRTLLEFFRNEVQASPLFQRRGLAGKILAALPSVERDAPPLAGRKTLPEMAEASAGAVLMIARIDGHFRHLALIARRLRDLGVKSVLFDVSRSKGWPQGRQVKKEDLREFSGLTVFSLDQTEIFPLFFNARAALLCIDWGWDSRYLVLQLQQRGIPVLAFYEGINDDCVLHPPAPPRKKPLPYRNTDFLLLPGEYYTAVYRKQKTFVVGLPSLRGFLREKAVFPPVPVAVVNVNFSYGMLEDCRRQFVSSAIEGCKQAGISFVLSQHPVDRGDLSPHSPSTRTIYEEIRRGTLLVSRFSTCVLEALALGKPVIYHNPHGEKYPKFQQDPLGAFQVARSTEELAQAIRNVLTDVAAGVDFRARARNFLHLHANLFAPEEPAYYAAEAIHKVITDDSAHFDRRVLHLAAQIPFAQDRSVLYSASAKRHRRLLQLYREAGMWRKALTLLLLDRDTLKKDVYEIFLRLFVKNRKLHFAAKLNVQ
ncbi:MAG: glycosyltransferase [Desulfovibrio sp.]|nr:glycosyltransferase [Desulfovibrio sp.]